MNRVHKTALTVAGRPGDRPGPTNRAGLVDKRGLKFLHTNPVEPSSAGTDNAAMPLVASREFMLERMLVADPRCDGRFITGVVSTRIYCLPSCRARKPRPENVVFYPSPAEARAAGLRPCRRCKPDDFYAGTHAEEARLEALLTSVHPGEVRNVAALVRASGVGASKLHEVFRVFLHTTPAEWLSRQRVAAARRLLLMSSRPVAGVAFEVGFESLSAFGEQFRRLSRMTPQAFRTLPHRKAVELSLPDDYPTREVLRDLGRDAASLTARVRGQTYTAALRLPSGPVVVHVLFEEGRALCTPVSPLSTEEDWMALHDTLLRVLGLSVNPARFEAFVSSQPDLAPLLEGQRGLRVPLVADAFDGLVWAVAGQQVAFPFACLLRRRLIGRLGREVVGGLYAPPSPEAVAALSVEDVCALGFTRARAQLLLRLAGMVGEGRLHLAPLASGTATRAERTLLAIPGIGPWTANYVLLRVLGFQDAVPAGDTALADGLQAFFALETRPDGRRTVDLMARFAPYRSLATFHLWHRRGSNT